MKPVLVQLGPFPVSSFGVFLLLAFVVGILVMRARTGRNGWDPGTVLDLSLYMIIGGVIGARIGYVLVNLKDFAGDPVRVVTIWRDAGLTFYGALAGGGLVAWVSGRKWRWSLGQIADAAAPAIALGYAIAMIGTLLYGLNYGRATALPWGVSLFGETRHPTQIYLMVASLIIFGILWAADRGLSGSGRLFWLFLFLYGLARIAIEQYMDSPRVVDHLTLAQIASIVAVVVSAVMLLAAGRLPGTALGTAHPGGSPRTAPRTDDPQPGTGGPRG